MRLYIFLLIIYLCLNCFESFVISAAFPTHIRGVSAVFPTYYRGIFAAFPTLVVAKVVFLSELAKDSLEK